MQELPNRKSPRANRYDYTSTGVYFVTVCTWDHEEYFGKIIDGKMVLNEIGRICDEELQTMLQKRPSVDLHAYVIMPNHVHLLLCVDECRDDGLPRPNSEGVICPNIHPKGVICPNVHPEGVICPNIQNDLNGSTTQNYITLDSNRVVV
ncbi:MAG: hypothetical protein LBI53_02550 [Candidatus Peribacteria bacterium]|nr:hypothetical protein [Candidatus Peribacteria bacterium]